MGISKAPSVPSTAPMDDGNDHSSVFESELDSRLSLGYILGYVSGGGFLLFLARYRHIEPFLFCCSLYNPSDGN